MKRAAPSSQETPWAGRSYRPRPPEPPPRSVRLVRGGQPCPSSLEGFRPPGRSTAGITLPISRLAAQKVQPRTQMRYFDLIVNFRRFRMVTELPTLSAESWDKGLGEFLEALLDHGRPRSDSTAAPW